LTGINAMFCERSQHGAELIGDARVTTIMPAAGATVAAVYTLSGLVYMSD
jgi:hypothetical protein